MTTLVERLRKFCVCFNTTCIGCEAASRLEAQEETIKKLREALEKIMHARGNPNSPITNMGRGLMREIAGAALDHTQNPTESGDSCIRKGVVNPVNRVNEATLPQIDTNNDCASCAVLRREIEVFEAKFDNLLNRLSDVLKAADDGKRRAALADTGSKI